MVTVTNYQVRQRTDGTSFITLELTGGLEMVQSSKTGNFYATVRKCNIPSTLSEVMAQVIIGTQMEGDVVRIAATPYEYTNKQTGEVMILSHSYAYQPKGASRPIGDTKIDTMQVA